MPPRSPVQAYEINRDRAQQKDRIRKNSKIREITVEDKSHHATLERVCIQITSIQAEYSSGEHLYKYVLSCVDGLSRR